MSHALRMPLAQRRRQSRHPSRFGPFAFALLLVLGPVASGVRAADYSCTNTGTGNWGVAGTWSSCNSTYPNNSGGDTYDAIVSTGTVTLDLAVIIRDLDLLGSATLDGPSNLTVEGLLDWATATQAGTGTTTVQGGMSFTTNANRYLGGDGTAGNGQGRTLVNVGGSTADWLNGYFSFQDSDAVFRNEGTFNAGDGTGTSVLNGHYFTGAGLFDNQGAFNVNLANTDDFIYFSSNTVFDNSDTVDVQRGELRLYAGGTHTGDFDVGADGLLTFQGGTHAVGGTVLAENLKVAGGTTDFTNSVDVTNLQVTGGTAYVTGTLIGNAIDDLTITSGTLNLDTVNTTTVGVMAQGSNGTLTSDDDLIITGLYSFNSGYQAGTGTTTAQGGIDFVTSATRHLGGDGTNGNSQGRTLVNAGSSTANWLNGYFNFQDSDAVFRNEGTFNAGDGTGTSVLNGHYFTGAGLFDNQGQFNVNLANTDDFIYFASQAVFDNDGTVDVQRGELRLYGGGTHTGSFTAGTDGLLTFQGGTHAVGGTVDAENLKVAGGTTDFTNSVDVTNLQVTGGTANFTGTLVGNAIGDLTITGGTTNLSTGNTITIGSVTHSTGTLSGSDDVTISGLYTFNSGYQAGTGTTTVQGGMSFTTNATRYLSGDGTNGNGQGRTLVNAVGSTANWLSGYFHFQDDDAVFRNQGTFNAGDGTSGTTLDGHYFTGAGLFDNQGTFNVDLANTDDFIYFSSNSVFDNSGTVDVQRGELRLRGGGTHTGNLIAGADGLINFNGGTHDIGGTVGAARLQVSAGTANFTGTLTGDAVGELTITGGTADFSTGSALTIDSLTQSGGIFTGSDDATITGPYLWTGGTHEGTGTTTAEGGITLNNNTTVYVGGDGIAGNGIGRTLVNAAGSTLDWTQGWIWLDEAGATLRNLGTFDIGDGTSALDQHYIRGPGTLDNQGTITVDLGQPDDYVYVSAGFDNAGTVDLQSGTLEIHGSGDGTGGNIQIGNGTTLRFQSSALLDGGTIDIASGGTMQLATGGVANATVNNATGGLIQATTGGSTTNILAGTINNAVGGQISVGASRYLLGEGTYDNDGSIDLTSTASGAYLYAGYQTGIAETLTLDGTGSLTLAGTGINSSITGRNNTDGDTLVNESTHTIDGQGQVGGNNIRIINRGLVQANGVDNVLRIDPLGTGTTGTDPGLINSGVLEAATGQVLELRNGHYRNYEGATQGTIRAQDTGIVRLFTNARIEGGTLETVGGGLTEVGVGQSARFDGVSNQGAVQVRNNADLYLLNTIDNQGSVLLDATNTAGTRIYVGEQFGTQETVTLQGGGTLTLGDQSIYNYVYSNNSTDGDTLINQDNLIEGAGYLGFNYIGIDNRATIRANAVNELRVDPSGNGMLGSTANFFNTGTLEAVGTSTLGLYGGHYANTGGVIQALDDAKVGLNSTARIVGGTLDTADNGLIEVEASQTAVFDSLSNQGRVEVRNNANLYLLNTIDNQGSVLLDATNTAGTRIYVGEQSGTQETVTLQGGGTLTLGDQSIYNYVYSNNSTDGDTLINQDNLIEGAGYLGFNYIGIDNRATIRANAVSELRVDPSGNGTLGSTANFFNTGTLEAVGTSTLGLYGGHYDNTGGVIQALVDATVGLNSTARIVGGTLDTADNGLIEVEASQTAVFDSLSNQGRVEVRNNADLYLLNTIDNQGSILLNATNTAGTRIYVGEQSGVQETVTLQGGGTLELGDSIYNYVLSNNGGDNDTLVNEDNLISGAGQIGNNALSVTNRGTIDASGTNTLTLDPATSGQILNDTTGTLRASGAGGMTMTGGVFENRGIVEALDGSSATFSASADMDANIDGAGNLTQGTWRVVDDGAGASITIDTADSDVSNIGAGATVTLSGVGSAFSVNGNTLDSTLASNAGAFNVLDGRVFNTAGAFANSGNVNVGVGLDNVTTSDLAVGGGADYSQTAGTTALDQGTITAVNVNIDGGIIQGTGTVAGNLNVGAGGSIGPGFSAGVIDVTGDLDLAGNWLLEIGGNNAALPEFDQIAVTGTATIDIVPDLIQVSLIDGYNPVAGNTFDVLTAASILGGTEADIASVFDFDNAALGAGLSWQVNLLDGATDTVQLEVITSGVAGVINATWDGGTDVYNAAHWTYDQPPLSGATFPDNNAGAGENVFNVAIDGGDAGASGVTLGNQDVTIDSLAISSGDQLTIGDGRTLTVVENAGNAASGAITNDGTLAVGGGTAQTTLAIQDVTLSGSGTLELQDATHSTVQGVGGGDILTQQSGHTITGSGNLGNDQLVVVNDGDIVAATGDDLTIDTTGDTASPSATFTNTGLVHADGGSLTILDTAMDNPGGELRVSGGGQLSLFDTEVDGGQVNVIDGSLVLDGPGVNATVDNGVAGTISVAAGADTAIAGSLNNDGAVNLEDGSSLLLFGLTVANQGTIQLDSVGTNDTDLVIAGTSTLTSTGSPGEVVLDADSDTTRITGLGAGTTLVNVDNTIRGRGQLGVDSLIIDNQAAGDVVADVDGETLVVDPAGTKAASPAGMTNSGQMRAEDGGTLALQDGSFDNASGTIRADGTTGTNRSTVSITDSTVTGGTVETLDDGQITLFDSSVTGATINISANGTLEAITGATVGSNESTIGGTINNAGQILVSNGSDLTIANGSSVANSGSIDIGPGGSNHRLLVDGTVTFNAGGEVNLGAGGDIRSTSSGTLVNTDNTIQGSGYLGYLNELRLENQAAGTVLANVDGSWLYVHGGSFKGMSNAGTMRAEDGGYLRIDSVGAGNIGGIIEAVGSNGGSANTSTVSFYASLGSSVAVNGGTVRTVDDGRLELRGARISDAVVSNSTTGIIDVALATANTIDGVSTFSNLGTTNIARAGGLTFGDGVDLDNQGAININGYRSENTRLGFEGTSVLSGGGTVVMSTAADTGLDESARIIGTQAGAALTNQDNLIQGRGFVGQDSLAIVNQGTIQADVVGETLHYDESGTAGDNQGTMRAIDGATLALEDATFDNQGTVEAVGAVGAGSAITAVAYGQSAGTTTLDVASTLTADSVSITGGTLAGEGAVITTGGVTIGGGGHVSPGFSAGVLNVNGDFTLDLGGVFDVELGPTAADNDRIAVTGIATLNAGSLIDVGSIGAFSPNSGDTFDILTAANIVDATGDLNAIFNFDDVDLAPGLGLQASISGGGGLDSLQLEVIGVAPTLITATWNDGNAPWATANWTFDQLPASQTFPDNDAGNNEIFAAIIANGGNVDLDQAVSIEQLTLSGGSELSGQAATNHTLAVNDTVDWDAGSGQTTTISGPGTVAADGQVSITGDGTKALDERTLALNGGATMSGNGDLTVSSGGRIDNAVGSTFDIQTDADILAGAGGGQLDNAGTLQKSAGTGTTAIEIEVNNSGTVDVQIGTLALNGGGTHSGDFQGTGTLELGGGTQTVDGAVTVSNVEVSGGDAEFNGTYDLTGVSTSTTVSGGIATWNAAATVGNVGDLTVSGGTANFDSGEALNPDSITVSAGKLAGSDNFTTASLDWSGGEIEGDPGTSLVVIGAAAITGTSQKTLDGRDLVLNGSTTFSGTGNISLAQAGTTITNNGTFDFQTDNDVFALGSTFVNVGTLKKTVGAGGGSNSAITGNVINSGTVDVQAGQINMSGGGTHTGATFTGPGLVSFGGGHMFDSITSIGTASVSFGTGTSQVNGVYNVSDLSIFAGTNTTFSSSADVQDVGAQMTVSGTVIFESGETIAPGTLLQLGGEIGGSDTLTVAGTTTWNGGEMSATAPGVQTILNGAASFGGGANKELDGRTLEINAGANWTGGNLIVGNGATVNNNLGSTFVIGGAGNIQVGAAGANAFNNAGALNKTSAGTTAIEVAFTNSGDVDIQAGALSFTTAGADTYSQTGGSTNLGGGDLIATTVDIQSGSLTGSGTVFGNTVIANGASIGPGASAGVISFADNFDLDGLWDLEIGGTNAATPEFDQIQVAGIATLGNTATIDVSLIDAFAPLVGNSFDVLTAASIVDGTGDLLGAFDFTNAVLGAGLQWQVDLIDDVTDTLRLSVVASGVQVIEADWAGGADLYSANNWGFVPAPGSGAVFPTNQANERYNVTIGAGSGTNDVTLSAVSPTIDRLTVETTASLTIANDQSLTLVNSAQNGQSGAIVNDGDIQMADAGSQKLQIDGDVQVSGSGRLDLGNNAGNAITGTASTDTLTNGVGHTIAGGGNIGQDNMELANLGVIDADSATAMTIDTTGTDMTNDGTLRASGTGGLVLADTAIVNNGTMEIQNASSIAAAGLITNDNNLHVGDGILTTADGVDNNNYMSIAGGTVQGGRIANAATGTVEGHGTVDTRIENSGLVRADGGTLTANGGIDGQSGTVEIAAGSALDLSGASVDSDADDLTMQTGATLDLGGNNFVVDQDYDNADFGTGNAFDHREGVLGSGEIQASGDTAQAITGADVSNGTQATATLDLGNVRVGDGATTSNYRIANSGTTGPALRGAIQDTGISDGRLSGAGVAAANYGPLATGADTADLSVTFDAGGDDTAAGVAGALTGQSVAVVNNFDNVTNQTLDITGAAYLKARGDLSSTTIDFGSYHVAAGTATLGVDVSNIAAATGGFTEDLAGRVASSIGDFTAIDGVGLVAQGDTVVNGFQAEIDTSIAGNRGGTMTVTFGSDGLGTSGLGLTEIGTDLGNRDITVTGAGYVLAAGDASAAALDLGARRVGDAASTDTLTISNDATLVAGFTETLSADFSGLSGALGIAPDPISGIAAGTPGADVTVTMTTGTSGDFGQTLTVDYTSNEVGGSGLGDTTVGSDTVAVTGRVYQQAEADIVPGSVDFGVSRVGDSVADVNIAVGNIASGALNDVLRGSISTAAAGFDASGDLGTGVAAGDTDNSSLNVMLDTSAAGSFSGSAIVDLVSHNDEMADDLLTAVSVALTGQVNNYASPEYAKTGGIGDLSGGGALVVLDLGQVVMGSNLLLESVLGLTNADVGAPQDDLDGSFSGLDTGGGVFDFTGFTAFTGLAAGDTIGGLLVSFDSTGLTAGSYDGEITLQGVSVYTGLADAPLADLRLLVVAQVVDSVPAPSVVLLILPGWMAFVWVRRRRRA